MDNREEFYDREIAPALRKLAERCAAQGMSFAAAVQFADQGVGSTVMLTEAPDPTLRLTAFAARCKGNADLLLGWIEEDARKHGHSSVYMARLGVPHSA